MYGGGRAGIHVGGWLKAGYNLDELESVRQHLLRQNDIAAIQRAMRQVGITVDRATVHLVKLYNFDSQGIGFSYANIAAWRRLASGKGIIGDAAYMVHEATHLRRDTAAFFPRHACVTTNPRSICRRHLDDAWAGG